MAKKLTVGCRARILTLKEKPKQRGNDSSWRKSYGGREVLLSERCAGEFSVMLLGEGVTKLKMEASNIVEDEMAWVPESDMVWVNSNFKANLEFIDWYEENEDNFCPNCGTWFPEIGSMDEDGIECVCSKCGYGEMAGG